MVVTAGPILRSPHATIKAGCLDDGRVCVAGGLRYVLGGRGAGGGRQVLHRRHAAARVLSQHRLFPGYPAGLRHVGRTGNRSEARPPVTERAHDHLQSGLALDDMATAPIIYRRAVERGMGTWLPL